MGIRRRVLAVLSTGWILCFHSEVMFWSRWRPSDTLTGLVEAWLVYSIPSFFLLLALSRLGSDDADSAILAGAVFGWLVEGVIVQEAYAAFPFQLVWTPLAWHALISVLLGLHLAGRALGEWSAPRSAAFFAAVGAFWGFWATYWKLEDGFAIPVKDFASYALFGALTLSASYVALSLSRPWDFSPSRAEVAAFGALLAPFAAATLLQVPEAAAILPPLLTISLLAMRGRRGRRRALSSYASVRPVRCLAAVPLPMTLAAVTLYAALRDVWLEVNVVVALVTSGASLTLYARALLRRLRREHGGPRRRERPQGAVPPSLKVEPRGDGCRSGAQLRTDQGPTGGPLSADHSNSARLAERGPHPYPRERGSVLVTSSTPS